MDRAGLITLEQARVAGLSFDEPEPRVCPHCGAALDPLGAALAGRVAWVSAAPCPCEGAASEREAEARRRAALAAKEEAARREKALSRAGIPRRYWAAEADRPEFAEYIASFAGNGGAGLYIHGGVGAGKTHAASAMARLFAEAGYDVAFTTAKGMLERVKATFDEGGTEAAVARYAKCDVLVLDDLGKEDATEWSVGTVFSVLDARYEDMRPTIVTSNYAPGALADRLARGLDQLLESLAHADQLDPLDVEGVLALRSISERCAERIGDAARILEAQNEVLYAEERANAKPRENER